MRSRRSSFWAGATAAALAAGVAFAPGAARAADVARPNTSIAVPTPNQVLESAGSVTLSGSATDDVSVARVNVAIQDRNTNRWLRADSSWGPFVWLRAVVQTPRSASTTWTFAFVGPPGRYLVGAQAVDGIGRWDGSAAWAAFEVVEAATDLSPPDTSVSVPSDGQIFYGPGSIELAGAATDDRSVQRVQVAVGDRGTGAWLRPDRTWGSIAWLEAALSSGGLAWTWRFGFEGSSGLYTVGARAVDAAGNVDPTPAWVPFEIARPGPGTSRPNIVLILTDDQRWDSLGVMPNVQSLLIAHGVNFANGMVVDPLCCPSRAAILSGAYAHTNGVYNNEGPYGPFAAFDDRSTIATWLQEGGYRTALVGKYFNAYTEARASYVPPGWDRWVAFATEDVGGGKYFDYGLSVDGVLTHRGTASVDYSTDVLAGEATSFIRSTDPEQPLFLYFTPYGPHEPATAAPRHTGMFLNLAPFRPPSFDEADTSDKPAYMRAIPRLTPSQVAREDQIRRKQLQALQSIDDAVGQIVAALAETGRLANTMIVFMGDNGFLYGEHRWGTTGAMNKQVPYEESIRVPYVVRYDPLVPAPRIDRSLVLNIDLAPTFAALADVGAPGAEGTSLLPLLANPSASWRTDLLVEHHLTNVPSYCAVRSTTAMYVRYATREEELYLLASDPYELVNRASDPAQAALLAAMRGRAVQLCNPPPPGYSFT